MDVHSPKNGINRYWSIPILLLLWEHHDQLSKSKLRKKASHLFKRSFHRIRQVTERPSQSPLLHATYQCTSATAHVFCSSFVKVWRNQGTAECSNLGKVEGFDSFQSGRSKAKCELAEHVTEHGMLNPGLRTVYMYACMHAWMYVSIKMNRNLNADRNCNI